MSQVSQIPILVPLPATLAGGWVSKFRQRASLELGRGGEWGSSSHFGYHPLFLVPGGIGGWEGLDYHLVASFMVPHRPHSEMKCL